MVAAEMAVDLQWPNTLDLSVQVNRLRDGILTCFESLGDKFGTFHLTNLRHGMSLRAIHLGRAYCTLRCVSQPLELSHDTEPRFAWFQEDGMVEPELENVLRILEGKPDLTFNPDAPLVTKWAFHVIPSLHYSGSESKLRALEYFLDQSDKLQSLDSAAFADYLFCVIAFLSSISSRDMVLIDKK
jgi:hypothetical protein